MRAESPHCPNGKRGKPSSQTSPGSNLCRKAPGGVSAVFGVFLISVLLTAGSLDIC